MTPPAIIARRVWRFSCPFCNRSRSARARVSNHALRCWKNPAARSCGTCEHYCPPERGEPADYYSGYPGSPSEPRACLAHCDIALELPRGCEKWSPPSQPEEGQ